MSLKVVEYPALWIAGAACSGCSVSLLNAINPSIQNVLIDPVVPGKHVSLRFHAAADQRSCPRPLVRLNKLAETRL